ncbi:MAG: hypothetical protein AAF632_16120 [Bacteroidota bacterium]
MLRLLTLVPLLLATVVFAQESVLLNDFNTRGANPFDFDDEIEGITTDNQLFFLADNGVELWSSDGTPDGTQSIEAEEIGSYEYEVEVTDASGCVSRSEAVEIEGTVTALIDGRIAEGLKMYPNPATSRLLISSPLGERSGYLFN